jgi:crossover junction endodeoxyribonuclease RusA
MTQEVVLPWPPRDLSPNARVHWARKAKVTRSYREACYLLAKQARLKAPDADRIALTVTFLPPDGRRRDRDNLIASCKALFDGLADALQVDDAQFVLSFHVARDQIAGLVRVSVEPA